MGLNAAVYCDDVEKGRLRVSHPFPDLLFIDETGCPDINSDDPKHICLHNRWEAQRPCPHEHFWLVEHWLGNIWLIGRIREIVELVSEQPLLEYPVLWSKVIYSGTHSGDYLKNEEVVHLKDELSRIKRTEGIAGEDLIRFNDFLSKLEELVLVSLSVKKPISF